MKILFYSRLFYPHIGGVEKHVMEVSGVLVEKGHKVTVVTEKYQNGLKKHEIINGIHVYRISVGKDDWFKKFRIWNEVWKLRKLIGTVDIIHCHDVFFWYLPFRFLYPHKRVYITFHGYETVYPPSEKAKLVRKISELLSRGNICVGDYIKKWYGTKPTFVSYGGANQSKILDLKVKNSGGKIKIAFVGRLDADTGFIFYKQVLQLLKDKNSNFLFEIYGDGPLKKEAEKVGEVHGFVAEVEQEIAKADIVFVSSYLTILESLALKKPVFATYSNPLKEDYLRMTPFAKFIIIEKDPAKLAEKVHYYLRHSGKEQEIVEKAYKWAKGQTWAKVSDMYLRLWIR